MARIDKRKFDLTKTNDAIDRLLAVTSNPRHRFLLTTYYRHRYLEIAGRYKEIFTPEMTVDVPVYHFNYTGILTTLEGADGVQSLYGMWAQTHQSIFYAETEEIAVADHYIASVATVYQQVLGAALAKQGVKVDDENAYYLYKTEGLQQVWPYDARGRMIGEDVWEVKPSQSSIVKLDPADVVTTQQAQEILAPLIKPLPSFSA